MVSPLDHDFQCHRTFCVSISLSLSGREPFHVLSHRAVMSVKKEIKYGLSCSVGNPQTFLCGYRKAELMERYGRWRSQRKHRTDDRHMFQGRRSSWSSSLSHSCDVVLLEMEGAEFKKKPTFPESCFLSRIILGAILVLGVRMLGSSQHPKSSRRSLKEMALRNYKHELIWLLPHAERPDPH